MQTQIGRHEAEWAGHLLQMWFRGPIDRNDLEVMRRVIVQINEAGGGCYLLGDMTDCNGVSAEARKFMAEWSKAGTDPVAGTAVYGISFAVRAVVTLALSAIKFLGREPGELVMVKDEAEGRRWIAERKAARG